ncbi:hypothetical protein TNCV_2395021 [Trichonephila clavipes]|nr:hypothetical protein TNCV_2395021 [Trichonephila clavipes]
MEEEDGKSPERFQCDFYATNISKSSSISELFKKETGRIVPWVPTAASNGSDIEAFPKFNDSVSDVNSNETAIYNASSTTGNADASISLNLPSTTEGKFSLVFN